MDKYVNTDLIRKIKERLWEKGMTQRDLAEKLGVEQSIVSRWLIGMNAPRAYLLIHIAKILNIDIRKIKT